MNKRGRGGKMAGIEDGKYRLLKKIFQISTYL